jgi:GT2 family glycosyltransferase
VIAIVVLTHSRVDLLRRCVERVLGRTSDATREIVIWDNASTDETAAYLHDLRDPRVRIVRHDRNIGQNAYAPAFAMTMSEYLVELDDDVIDAPDRWDKTLLDAYRLLPEVGFLAANLVDNEHDEAARVMHHQRAHMYREVRANGIRLLEGPTGGGCAITSREVYDRVGGFRQNRKHIFWSEDDAYIKDIGKVGLNAATLADLEVLHAGGAYYSPVVPEKVQWWDRHRRQMERKATLKRALLGVPLVRPLNERFCWFEPPNSAR